MDQFLHWSKFFDRERPLVLRGEDFFRRTKETLEEAQDFLGLSRHEIAVRSGKSRT